MLIQHITMKTSAFTTFTLAIGLVASVMIPEDAPDGLFEASLDKRDETYDNFTLLARHVPREMVPTAPTKRSARFDRRYTPLPISREDCSDGDYVDPSDFSMSKGELIRRCDSGTQIGKKSVLAYKVGSSTAYACSYGGQNPCSRDEIDAAFLEIDKSCGSQTKTGWVLMDNWAKSYGREILTNEICGIL